VKDNNEWRIRYNYAFYALREDMDNMTFMAVGKLKGAGHIVRMDQQRPARTILNAKPEGRRKRGRHKLR
jgi:hypothetical protein